MKTASVTEAKNRLSALLAEVRAGETVLILDRGVPVARLEPVAPQDDADGKLARLQKAGLIRVGKEPPPLELILQPGPALPHGASMIDIVLEERRGGY